jgi:ubiquinone/menaquinone biosynthesis C-methylase UbiE
MNGQEDFSMTREKSEKELAYLRDLYIAPDWGERFAGLIDENIALPKEGRVLYIASGTGAHALAVLGRAGKNVTLVCVDESEECIELSRAKAQALKLNPEFRHNQFEALDFDDDQFELVIGDTSLVPVERLPEIIAEMVRVTAPGGTVALSVATAPSFGEFFSIYWEALANSGIQNHEHDVESLIIHVPTVSDVEEIAKESGLEKVSSWTRSEEFDYASGQEFLESPLISDFLLTSWMENLPDTTDREKVGSELVRIIDEERSGMDFALSVKATLVTGRKPE